MSRRAEDASMIVLGAGISGLTAARALQDRGYRPRVLEACYAAGGLTRSMTVGDFSFDYTGHLLHLARCGTPAAVPYAQLCDEDWQRIERRSYCLIDGALVTAPVQYHLGQLPAAHRDACIDSFEARPALPSDRPATFRDFIVSGFGQRLADLFLIPQNQKTMATDLDRLSMAAVKRFFPPPDAEKVRAGFAASVAPPREYNSQFWYPRVGGIQRLVDGLAAGLERSVVTGAEVVEIDLAGRTLVTRSGDRQRWDCLFTSMPLRSFCRRTSEPELQALGDSLTHSATITFNLGVRGTLPPALGGVHWVYVPEPSLPFYRVGIYSNISPDVCPADCFSLYVEVGVPGDALKTIDIVGDLQRRVLADLARLGWIDPAAIVCCVAHVLACAYVHHTPAREQAVERIMDRLRSHGVHPIGRYGHWDYTSMEDSIFSALAAVEGAP